MITRFRLRTYPAPPARWHDTWSFRLDDTVELLTWLHEILPELDRRVEPVVAATRLPDVPLREGTARPDGTVLLLPDGRAGRRAWRRRLHRRHRLHPAAGPLPRRRRVPAAGRDQGRA